MTLLILARKTPCTELEGCPNCYRREDNVGAGVMRKKAINQVYDVLRAVYELEKELKKGNAFAEINREDCSGHLKQARHELHQVLDEVYSSDFRPHKAA
jgi:hypothetical protein